MAFVFLCMAVKAERRWAKERVHEGVVDLQRNIYGTNTYHFKDFSPEQESQLDSFGKAGSSWEVSIACLGGLVDDPDANPRLSLRNDGRLSKAVHGTTTLITTLPRDRCAALFREVLSSGILNYSDGVVQLKKDLERLDPISSHSSVTCNPKTVIHIQAPDLNVNHDIEIYAPEMELKNYPGIIEFQLVMDFKKKLLALVPDGIEWWK
jgi:hypothetical protein